VSYRGVTLRLDNGAHSISTTDVTFPPNFEYGDNEEFLKFFVLSYIKLLDDSPLRSSHGGKPWRLYYRFLKRLTSDRLDKTIKLFSSYSHEILRNEFSTGSDSLTRIFHEFMRDTPIFKEYHEWIKTGRPELLEFVLTFLLFGKKLEYDDPEFDTTAFRGWCEVEDRLRTLEFSSHDIGSLRNIVRELLPPIEVDHLLPKFGPGKVAETGVRDVYDKLSSLSLHPRLEYAFYRDRPGRSADEGFGRLTTIDVSRHDSIDYEWLMFVPKDITKSRSISKIPNAFMYFQQEVLRWMVNSMEHGQISRFVTLSDQQNSRDAALHGSKYLCTDTIDLSSASDSVHVDLVRGVFPSDYLFYLMATRTSKVRTPDGQIRQIYKFAPMGSALCFPVQCILFTAVCIYSAIAVSCGEATGVRTISRAEAHKSIRGLFTRTRSESTPFIRRYEPPVVYGDDIAIDSRHTSSVTSTLERLGFTVNQSKSFIGSQGFRESCGIFAFEGQDVTPVLFRLPLFKRGSWDAKVYSSFIGLINYLGDKGYYNLRSFLIRTLREYGFHNPLPFTEDRDSFGIYTKLKKRVDSRFIRWNAYWQVNEERVQGIGPRYSKRLSPDNLSDYTYDQWWRSKVRGHTPLDQTRGLRIRPQETRLAPIWARCE
jgi:hypothetical protein